MSANLIANEVNQQFLRRTPVKLRQFSRLLIDMTEQSIDPLRIKAFLSQVNKTRESCVSQEFDSTAKLLDKVYKQLSMSEDEALSQKPLLKRLAAKLNEHSEKLELGVKPQKEIAKALEPKVVEEIVSEVEEIESEVEEELLEEDSLDHSLEEQGIYLDKSHLIFVSKSAHQFSSMSEQFVNLGGEVHHVETLAEGKQLAIDNPGSLMVAALDLAENNEQLDDNDVDNSRIPLIFIAQKDNQTNRLLALRSGGTGFLVEPLSISSLLELIERQYDIHADAPYRVLVMEDSKAQARFYEKVLSKGNFDIRVVIDPTLLLEALIGFEPEVILMDMQMPGCSGIELTRIIRQMASFTHVPIIFLSAEESHTKQNQALLSGGSAFIVKPVQKEQLHFMTKLYAHRCRNLLPQLEINSDTGFACSSQFKHQIAVEASRMTRNNCNAGLAIIELDQCESLVQSEQYALINVAINQLALILKKRLRKSDIIGHLATGQLGVMLTSGNKDDWQGTINEIRSLFLDLHVNNGENNSPLSISAGLATLVTNSDAHQWYDAANQRLQLAKNSGGDQIFAGEQQ